MVTDDISFFFDPKSIAIIGASNQKGSVGKALFENALRSGKNRKIYPVSIKRKKVFKVFIGMVGDLILAIQQGTGNRSIIDYQEDI